MIQVADQADDEPFGGKLHLMGSARPFLRDSTGALSPLNGRQLWA